MPRIKGRKVGRPKIVLSPEQIDTIDKLAAIHCTDEEVAENIGISVDTLVNNFSEPLKKGKLKGKRSLRRLQYELAQKGDRVMLIWLGKQLLQQKDKVEQTNIDGDDLLTDEQLRDKIERLLDQRKIK